MDFVYSYKTADGVRHEAEISAPSRDAAFVALRLQGIRPIKVVAVETPHGKSHVVRKWIFRFAIMIVSAVVGAVALQMSYSKYGSSTIDKESDSNDNADGIVALPRPRGQIGGFATLDLASVFNHPSEVYLSRYAQPGIPLDEDARSPGLEEDLINCLKSPIIILPRDPDNVKELKRIVVGIKNDITLLLASGRGLNDILAWLDARQKMERVYRERILNDSLRHASSREDTNHLLHTLGLEELPPQTIGKK